MHGGAVGLSSLPDRSCLQGGSELLVGAVGLKDWRGGVVRYSGGGDGAGGSGGGGGGGGGGRGDGERVVRAPDAVPFNSYAGAFIRAIQVTKRGTGVEAQPQNATNTLGVTVTAYDVFSVKPNRTEPVTLDVDRCDGGFSVAGYSVSSGTFFHDGATYTVVGAPRANNVGKVRQTDRQTDRHTHTHTHTHTNARETRDRDGREGERQTEKADSERDRQREKEKREESSRKRNRRKKTIATVQT